MIQCYRYALPPFKLIDLYEHLHLTWFVETRKWLVALTEWNSSTISSTTLVDYSSIACNLNPPSSLPLLTSTLPRFSHLSMPQRTSSASQANRTYARTAKRSRINSDPPTLYHTPSPHSPYRIPQMIECIRRLHSSIPSNRCGQRGIEPGCQLWSKY